MRWGITVIVAAGITIAAVLLAVRVETCGEGKRTKDGHVLVVDLEPVQRGDYIVTCDEARYQKSFEKFRQFVKVDSPLLVVPGGPMVVALADLELTVELQAPRRVIIEVLKRHAPNRIVLMAHEGCLVYDSIGAWHGDSTGVRNLQIVHLLQAKDVLQTWLPHTRVELYYGENTGENQIGFLPVNETLLTEFPASSK